MSRVQTIYLKDYKAPEFNIKSVDLVFNLFEEYTQVTNTMSIKRIDKNTKDIILNSVNLELLDLCINNLKINEDRYIIEKETIRILDVPNEFKLTIINKIYPQINSELEGLYKSGDIFCTQNEPEGFRRITPYLDRPDVMAVFSTTIIADKNIYPLLLSNGNLLNSFELSDGFHGVTWSDPHPKPSYLFALVAGDLGAISDEFTTKSGDEIKLNIYCDKGNESKCYHAMESLKKSMLWDEQKYGREYDLEIYNIVAVDSFNMGAMENKGLNIFNSAYVLADEDTASDANFMGIQSVIAHEYFHNWTGNRITCRDWFQLTLKEGLTVFRDQSFSSDINSKEVCRIEDVKALRERQFVEDASPTAHPIQPDSYMAINNFYTATVYEKGAEIIRMIHTLLGEDNYRRATDLYFKSFDGQAVRTDDFLWAMSEASGIDLIEFKRWYHQSGTPKLHVNESFENNKYKLILTQEIPNTVDGNEQKPYFFPLKMALLNSNGDEIIANTLIISKEKEEFIFEMDEKPILSINRDFSAPIIVELQKNNYPFLMRYDKNSFVRYESAQSFGVIIIEAIMRGEKIDKEFIDSFGYILSSDMNLSYKALLLELPSISTLMQRQDEIDFEVIYKAKEKLSKCIATTYEDELIDIYDKNHKPSCKDIDAKSIAERSIKNCCLKLLSELKNNKIIEIVNKQYKESLTMTDRVVALDILENISSETAKVALNNFYKKYSEDTLVMNKYFTILASSQRRGVLERVISLQNNDAYNELVPNLVRSLIGSFARNYRYFHAKEGDGYKFIANKIIEIDKINPQIASSLAGAFKIYKKLNLQNKKAMKIELERILSTPSISKNVYEIVSKVLKV
ncbi:MAG: aminopeptidase N [Sulfurimonas sp.]|nr:aminopeptidase N [Sulfurimonas sp.]